MVSGREPRLRSLVPRFAQAGATGDPSEGVPVDIELVLAVDASYSMGAAERALQVQGYVAALRDPEVAALVKRGSRGRIALAYLEWAGPEIERVLVPWTLIDGPASARRFAGALEAAPVTSYNSVTGLSDALLFAAGMFSENGFAGDRHVIDISGDGITNTGPKTSDVRDALVRQGITINGLPILLEGSNRRGQDVEAFYRTSVIGGEGAFAVAVTEAGAFASAIRSKLLREISELCAPGQSCAETG